MNKQKIENLITLLNDGKWHSAQELTERVIVILKEMRESIVMI